VTATSTDGDDDAATTAVLPVTVVDTVPVVSGLAAQNAQVAPTLIVHDLSTDTPILELTERSAVPSGSVNGVVLADLTLAADHPVSVTFLGETAGYKNTIGYYRIAEDGSISEVTILFANASQAGSGGSLIPGESSVALDVAAGDRLGFFIIADGFRKNNFDNFSDGSFAFRDGDAAATIASNNPALVFIGNNGSQLAVAGNVYHTTPAGSAAPLNADGLVHALSGLDTTTGGLVIGFEDLFGLGDRDFDDLIFRVDFGLADGETLVH